MKFEMRQISKELVAAQHKILQGNETVGSLDTKGGFGYGWPDVELIVFGYSITMAHKGNSLRFDSINEATGDKEFKPCTIQSSDGLLKGEIYQFSEQTGIFTKTNYLKMILGDEQYYAYPCSCGKEGSRIPVYFGDKQVGLILKDYVIVDDMHNYIMFVAEDEYLNAVALFCAYMYSNGAYKAGVEIKHGEYKAYRKTSDKFLLSKDDRSFENKC